MSGIGKYPYICVEESQLDFGKVLVGKVVEKTFKLSNQVRKRSRAHKEANVWDMTFRRWVAGACTSGASWLQPSIEKSTIVILL